MIEVEAEDEAWADAVPDWSPLCAKAAERALSAAPDRAAASSAPGRRRPRTSLTR